MTAPPCTLPGGCPYVAAARGAALDAVENSGEAIGAALGAERHAKIAARRVAWGNALKWSVGVAVTLWMGWQTARGANQEQRIVEAVSKRVLDAVDSKLTAHLQSTQQSNLDTAREALKLQHAEELAARNPAPIAVAPDSVAPHRR